MLSGSAPANVAVTGNITIPMMKRLNYDKNFAGAVEATASTGGQLAPPVMGAGAFLMQAQSQQAPPGYPLYPGGDCCDCACIFVLYQRLFQRTLEKCRPRL